MYCWKCGKENRDQASFCKHCGAQLTDATRADTSTTKPTQDTSHVEHVPATEYVLPDNYAKLCPQCGGAMFVHETTERRSFKKTKYIILYFVPIVGWLLLFLIYLNVRDKVTTVTTCERCGYSEKG